MKTISEKDGFYFLTPTIVDWVDVFSRQTYRDILLHSIRFCQKNKGLRIHAWCIMSNHLHLIASAADGFNLAHAIRDLKRHTSTKVIKYLQQDMQESRRAWMLERFDMGNGKYRFWQPGNEPKIIYSNPFLEQKLNYIHQNPVKAGLVYEAEHYVHSSAIDYAGGKGLLEIDYAG